MLEQIELWLQAQLVVSQATVQYVRQPDWNEFATSAFADFRLELLAPVFSKFTILSGVFLALTAFTVIVALVFRNPLLVYTAVFMVVTNALLFIWAQLSVSGISVRRSHPRLAVATLPLEVAVELTNQRRTTRYGTLGFDLHQELTGGLAYTPVAFLDAPPQTPVAQIYRISPARRGEYKLGPFFLYGGDPFGFYKCWKRLDVASELIVLPKPVEFRFKRPASVSRMAKDEMETVALSGESTEFLGVREYRSGEPFRRVHWRSTARLGRLISRQYELNVAGAISALVLVDRDMLRGTAVDNPLEYSLSMAAGLARATASERFRMSFLALLGKQHVTLSGSGRRYYQELAIMLARLKGDGAVDWNGQAKLILNYLSADSHLIVFTANLDSAVSEHMRRLAANFRRISVVAFDRASFIQARRPEHGGPRLSFGEGFLVSEVFFGDNLTRVLEQVLRAAGAARSRR